MDGEGFRRGLRDLVIVFFLLGALVGVALYQGGKWAWHRLATPPPPAADNPVVPTEGAETEGPAG